MKKGWQIKTIGDVCEVIAGQSPEGKFYNAEGKGMPFYQGKKDFGDKFIEAPTTWTTQTTKIAKEGDILMSVRAPVGPVNFATDEVCIGRGLAAIRSSDELNRDFLFYQLWHLQPEIAGREGAVFASINKAEIEALPLAYAPLAEQQRIVGLLDEAFAGLATAKANAEKNLQNARALFESHLQSVFTQRGPGWVEKSLGETCEMYQPKTIGTKDLVPDGPYPVFGANGVIGRYDKFNHEEPQLLVTCGGATCGSVNISEPNSWITGNAMVVRPKDHALNLHFLEFVFRGGIDISAAITGTAQPQITRTNLSTLLIRFPKSVTEQTRLAEKFETLTEETQRLARLSERKHAALEALTQSLLHQAFTGAL